MGRSVPFAAALWCVLCAAAVPARGEVMEIPGSGSPEFVLRQLAEGFNKLDPNHQVLIPHSARSVGGIRAVRRNEAVIARVSRRPTGEEAKGLRYLPFVRDAVVFAVGSDVNVRSLTVPQAAEIFSGRIVNWRELGGADAPIRVIVRSEDEAILQILRRQLEPFSTLNFTNQAKVAYHASEAIELLDRFDAGIAFVARSTLRTAKTGLRAVSLEDVAPDNDNIGSARYPLLIDYGFIYKEDRLTDTARRFLEFIFSEPGRRIILNHGLVPLPRQPS